MPDSGTTATQARELLAQLEAGESAAAEAGVRELLRRAPDSALLWTLLAKALRAQGKDSVGPLQQAAALQPDNAQVHTNLGNALQDAGQLEAALRAQRQAVAANPEWAEAHNNLGSVLTDLGRVEEALESFRRAVALQPGFALAHANIGNLLRTHGRLAEAVTSYQQALAQQPSADLHHRAGSALRDLGRLEESVASHGRGLELEPGDFSGWERLSVALHELGRTDEAVEACQRALALKPGASMYTHLGVIEVARNRAAEALECALRALELDPRSTGALVLLSEVRVARGELAEAEAALRRALEIEPDMPQAWAALERFVGNGPQGEHWRAGAQQLLERPVMPRREIWLRYALGRHFDRAGDFEQAFTNYHRANELTRRLNPPYDPARHSRQVDRIVSHYDQSWLRGAQRDAAPGSERAVLIVGMWRSGTTLAEQIMASHPAVHGAGEPPFLGKAVKRYDLAISSGAPEPGALEQLGREYLERLTERAGGAQRVIDKMASNYHHLGLLHAALPQARIIHMQRDPIDTCLSMYFQDFLGAHRYATDLGNLVHHYRHYQRLMQHWRANLPASAILEVPYEGLVADQELWTRRMLQFVGLEWDPRCLEFHRATRSVLTNSKWQVRRGLYRSSVGRSRHYEPFIGPLLALREASA